MSFFNSVPLPIFVLLVFAILGFCAYLMELSNWGKKIELFSNYRQRLVEFHNNIRNGTGAPPELRDYLSENALRINLDSVVTLETIHPLLRISTGITQLINDIITGKTHDFTQSCQEFDNMLTQNIGFFKDRHQQIRSKLFNPIHLVKGGVSLILNSIPIVNLIPTNLKDFLSKLFIGISIIETLLSLFSQKSLLLSLAQQIRSWIPF